MNLTLAGNILAYYQFQFSTFCQIKYLILRLLLIFYNNTNRAELVIQIYLHLYKEQTVGKEEEKQTGFKCLARLCSSGSLITLRIMSTKSEITGELGLLLRFYLLII